ncbi:MAG: TPM domain-containing protein [Bacteroidia bacterium]|nr:TPM domain-containing protein [Bacteroidia bacterium]
MSLFKFKAFSKEEEKKIQQAIRESEKLTTGEIRLLVAANISDDILKFAEKKFHQMGMYNTNNRNAVLFVLCLKKRQVAVWADEGIYKAAGEEFWKNIVEEIVGNFKENHGVDGIVSAIRHCGDALRKFFPAEGKENPNELSDEIEYES